MRGPFCRSRGSSPYGCRMHIAQQRLRLYAIAGAAATTFVASPAGTDAFGMLKLLTLFLFASACALLALPLWRPATQARRIAFTATGAFVLALVVVFVVDGGNRFQSVYGVFGRANGLLCYLSLAMMLLTVVMGFDRRSLPSLLTGFMLVGALLGVYGTVQTLGLDPIDWQRGYEDPLIATFGNPDFSAAFFGLAALAALTVALDAARTLRWRAGAGVIAAWLLWLAWRTTTIQGVLAFAVGVTVMAAVWLLSPMRSRRMRALRAPFLGLVGLAGGLFVLGLADRGPVASRLFDGSVLQRLYTWQAALSMFRARPLTGVGLDAYGDWYPTVRSAASIQAFGQGMYSNEGHSVLLTLLGTGGLLLTLPYLALWAVVGRQAWRIVRRPDSSVVEGGLIAIWLAYLVDSLFSMDQLGVAVWGWLFAGAVLAASLPSISAVTAPTPVSRTLRVRRMAAVAVLVTAALVVGAYPLWLDARIVSAEALPAVDTASRAVAVDELLAVADSTPEPLRLVSIATRLQQIGAGTPAVALALRSAHRYPGETTLWEWIATYYEADGKPALAVPARRVLTRLDPLGSDNRRHLADDLAAMG